MSNYSELLSRAKEAQQNAYCPLSNQPVGAALLSDDGEIFTGCNIEYACYGGSVCAESVALLKALSEGKRKFKALAISNGSFPCGACRQFVSEFGIDVDIVLPSSGSPFRSVKLRDLLPHNFGPEDIAKV